MDNVFQKLATNTFTIYDLAHRIRILKSYLETKIFEKNAQIELTAEEQAFINSLGNDFLHQFSEQNISQVFEQLQKKFDAIKPLVIYLPFEMPAGEINRLGTQLRADYGQDFFMDVKFDPDLIGGCALVWKGIYKDYSLRATIGQKKQEILESFKGRAGAE